MSQLARLLYNIMFEERWWLLSGIFAGVGFLIPALWFVAVFGIFFFIHGCVQSKTVASRFVGGMQSGTLTALASLFWYFSVYPVSWLPIASSWFQLPVIFLCWIISAVALSFGTALLALVLGRLLTLSFWWLATVPVLWVLAEVFNSFAFSVATIGYGITPNAHFSFSYVGYHLASSPLFIAAAGVGGVYALSFLAAATGALIYFWWRRQFIWQELVAGYLLLVFVGWFLPPASHDPSRALRVAVIDTDFDEVFLRSEDGLAKKQAILQEAIAAAAEAFPAYIVLPEDSRLTPIDLPAESVYPWFRFGRGDVNYILIDSGTAPKPSGGQILRGTIIDGFKDKTYQLDKQYLVPQGEFVPYASQVLFRSLGLGTYISTMHQARAYTPGPLKDRADLPSHLPALLFCFESASPVGVLLARGGREVPFVAHPFSHAWFHAPIQLWRQLDTMLRVQARWGGVPIVSAGNQGAGALYTPEGEKVPLPIFSEGERYRVRVINL